MPALPRASESAGAFRANASAYDRTSEPPHLLCQALFREALNREVKRADRFEEAFALIVVALGRRVAPPSRWAPLLAALSPTQFDADVVGWFEQGAVLGIIRSLAGHDADATVTALADTVRQMVARCVPADHSRDCSVRLEVYSPHGDAVMPALVEDEHRRWTLRTLARDAAKRTLDIAGSIGALVVFSPLFLGVAVLVKLTSKGPMFFRQQRVGKAGRPFIMLKFRTMHVNADHAIHKRYVEDFIQSGAASGAGGATVFKIVNDPRVTPIGRFLRRSSLDELPQFWNVLTGEMSLVGPRPPLAYEVARYKRWHRRRVLEAKPGITGLWQVTGRSRTTFDEMVRLDLRYAKSYSLWTDLKILLATPRAVLSGRGAH